VGGFLQAFDVLFAFVLMLGVLITVHEFGHFLVAKLCGVRVLKFSVGFGSPIGFGRFRLRWERRGTEYVVAWIPLGGFVKMLGEQPGEEESEEVAEDPAGALSAKPVWQKLAVVFAGPVMNLALPVVVFLTMLGAGVQRPLPVVGTVEDGSPAARVDLRPGDRVLAVDGEPVRWWDELEEGVRAQPGEAVELTVGREGEELRVEVPVAERRGLDVFQQASDVGWVGLRHRRQDAVLGIASAEAPAVRAGLRSGDEVLAVAGEPVEDWTAFARTYGEASRTVADVALRVRRDTGGEEAEERTVRVPALGSPEALGVQPATVLVRDVTPDSPADEAGLQAGDLIVALDGEPVGSFASFAESVRASEGRTLRVTVAREGRTETLAVTPRLVDDPATGGSVQAWMVGIRAEDATLPGATAEDRVLNPLVSVPRAAGMTWEIAALTVQAVGKIVTGDLSRRNLGGPIEIARQAHTAMEIGWERYINLLVLISINLAILNLRHADRHHHGGAPHGLRLLERPLPPLVELPRLDPPNRRPLAHAKGDVLENRAKGDRLDDAPLCVRPGQGRGGKVIVLAVESATAVAEVAVLEGGRLRGEATAPAGRPHAAALLPAAERALHDAGCRLEEVEGFALSIGPGSFTGLRIGLATVKAFALGTDLPVAPVPALAALAWPLRRASEREPAILACLDARRGELYAAGYRGADEGLLPWVPEGVWRPGELADRVAGAPSAARPERVWLVGEGLEGVQDALREAGIAELRRVPRETGRPRARAVGELGLRILGRGHGRPARDIVPRYLRRAEAEVRRTGQRVEGSSEEEPAGELL